MGIRRTTIAVAELEKLRGHAGNLRHRQRMNAATLRVVA